MGWDGYAEGPHGGKLTPEIKAKFAAAALLVQEVAGTCDGLLYRGALDVSTCAAALRDMGLEPYSDHDAAAVKTAWENYERIEFNSPVTGELWALASARMFLKIAAENGCSFRASW